VGVFPSDVYAVGAGVVRMSFYTNLRCRSDGAPSLIAHKPDLELLPAPQVWPQFKNSLDPVEHL